MPREPLSEASEIFLRRRLGPWSPDDESALEARLAHDAVLAEALRTIKAGWLALERHRTSPALRALLESAREAARVAAASNARMG